MCPTWSSPWRCSVAAHPLERLVLDMLMSAWMLSAA